MASTSLSRNTWGTATNDKIFTMSVWVKRSGLGYQQIVNSYDGSTGNDNQLKFQSIKKMANKRECHRFSIE